MSREFDTLTRDYQRITASPELLRRVEARTRDRENASWFDASAWRWPALGAGAVAAMLLAVLITSRVEPPVGETARPIVANQVPGFAGVEVTARPVAANQVPGFGELATTTVTSASLKSPSFMNLRSVNAPALPDKPEHPVL